MIEQNHRNIHSMEPGGVRNRTSSSPLRPMRDPEATIAGIKISADKGQDLNGENEFNETNIGDIPSRNLDNRNEQSLEVVRDERTTDREGIIDLTNNDDGSFRRGLDPDAMDAQEWLTQNTETEKTDVDESKVQSAKIDQNNGETPSPKIRVKKFREKSAVSAAIEEKRKKIIEKLEGSKMKSKQLTNERNKTTSRSRGKSKVVKRESDTTHPESVVGQTNNTQVPTSQNVGEETLGTSAANSLESPKGKDYSNENKTDKIHQDNQKQSDESRNPEELERNDTLETNRNEFDIKSIEITNEPIVSTEDENNTGCTWFLCSGAKYCGNDQHVADVNDDINDGNQNEKNNQDDEISPTAVSESTNPESTNQGLWSTLKTWIDPAPSQLMESLKLAEEARVLKELEACAADSNSARTEEIVIDQENQAKILSRDASNDVEADRIISLSQVDKEQQYDQDQDSGAISDADLNSIPALRSASIEHLSIKTMQAATSSAFDPVKPRMPSPVASIEEHNNNIVNADDDVPETNLFDDDLHSIPSVKEDVTAGVSDLQPDDLGSFEPLVDSKSIAEKVAQIKSIDNKNGPSSSNEWKKPYQAKADESLEARRQLLVKELRSSIATFGRYDIRCANISVALGDSLNESGDYTHAIRMHKDATTIYSCKLGDDHTTTMNAKIRLGQVLENAKQYDEAISMYYLVTVMRRALNGENDPAVADGLVQMSQCLRKKADFLQAIKELKRALKIYRESLGDSHEKVASTVDQIASLYVTVGDFDKSSAILEEVVKLKAATTGMKSVAVAQTLSSLATSYECSEKFNDAMKALKKAYKIYTELGGFSSEDSTSVLNRIAQLYEATGDQNRASIAYLGVLRARKILRGVDSLSVGETYFRLGHSLRETGQFDKALKCLKEALPIFVGQGVEMNDMKMVADIMHEMAFINQDKGNYQDAVRIFKQELSVRRKIGQPEFPLIARTLNHLGVAEFELENNSRALKYLVEALTIFQERGEQGTECAEVLFNTGLVFDAVENKERALEAYTESARIFREHGYSDSHPHLRKAIEKIEKVQREYQVSK